MRDAITTYAGIDYVDFPEQSALQAAAGSAGGELKPAPFGRGSSTNCTSQFVRPNLIQPTVIMDYPVAPFPRWPSASRTIRRTRSGLD